MKKNLTMVKVDWVDSCSDDAWQHESIALEHTVAPCSSVGYLLKKNKKEVSLSLSRSDLGKVFMVLAIPRGCIKKITTLKEV